MKADPKNPYPPFAKAYGLMSAGQLTEARKYAAKACELSPDHDQMQDQLLTVRFALKEYDSLAAEFQAKLATEPLDRANHTNLLRALIAAGKTEDARRANEQYIKRVSDAGHDSEALLEHIRRTLAYLLGDSSRFANLSPVERNDPDTAKRVRVVSGLESGDPKRIAELLEKKDDWKDATSMLLLGFAWQIAGDRNAAKKCFDDAAEEFASGGRKDRETVRLLKLGEKLKLSDVDDLATDIQSKAMVLIALAARCPSNRIALLDRAEKLNLLGAFHHHLIRKAIASVRAADDGQ